MATRKTPSKAAPAKTAAGKRTTSKKTTAKTAAAKRTTSKPPTTGRRASKRSAAEAERDQKVLELRRAGVPFDRIAVQLKFTNRDTVHAAYERALDRTLPQPADAVRRLELDRLERLMTPLWSKAMRGDMAAIDRLARLSEQRTRVAGEASPLLEPDRDRELGPAETATVAEVRRMAMSDHTLAAAAVILARCLDESETNSVAAATAARELRMTMNNLRGIYGFEPGKKGEPGGESTVVPESRLAQVRKRAEARGRRSR